MRSGSQLRHALHIRMLSRLKDIQSAAGVKSSTVFRSFM